MIRKIIGWIMVVFSSLMLIGFLNDISDGYSTDLFDIVLAMFMAWILWSGIRRIRKSKTIAKKRKQRRQDGRAPQKIILEAARALHGRVTPNEVAARSSLSPKVARAELRKLADDDFCQIVIGASGMTVYFFPEFEDVASKRDLLEDSHDDEFSDFDAALAGESEEDLEYETAHEMEAHPRRTKSSQRMKH